MLGPGERLEKEGWRVHRLGVDRQGVVDLDQLGTLLSEHTRLVSLMLGNNETGVMQPIAEAARLCRAAGVSLHADAVQVLGKLPLDFRSLDVAAMSITAHKLHGPVGIGALVLRHEAALAPQLFGGFQQESLRPGTEPLALVVGFCRAIELWQAESQERARRMAELRDHFEARLLAGFPDVQINGAGATRLPHTSNLSFRGVERQALLIALDLEGVACSTGSACASGSSEPSHVLRAMGLGADVVGSALRFSLGAETTRDEVDEAVERILGVLMQSGIVRR